jgi:hypothetical protein
MVERDGLGKRIWRCGLMVSFVLGPDIDALDFGTKAIKGLGACNLLAAYAEADAALPPPTDPSAIGRNLLHNSRFGVAQRGNGPFTINNFATLDRWHQVFVGDTMSVSRVTLTDADRAAIGDEAAQWGMQITFTGNAGAASYSTIQQRIERVRRLAGQSVTTSFWAKAALGAPKLGIQGLQYFGTGGSPSADVALTGTAVTLSTAWTRYSATAALPSVAGKILGTDGNDSTRLTIFLSSGATNSATAGSIAVQSGTVTLWDAEMVLRTVALPGERLDPAIEQSDCQRFAIVTTVWVGSASAPTTLMLPSAMVMAPVGPPSGTGVTGGGAGFHVLSATRSAVVCYQTTPGLQTLTISADL